MQNSGCPEFFRQKYHHIQPTQAGILTENQEIVHNTWFTDEAHVYLNGGVNKQNYRFWDVKNHHQLQE
jgi:hypothetical protein